VGHVLFRKRVTRTTLIGFLAAQQPCIVAMEACAGAHYWAREFGKLGHCVRLIAPAYVKPFVKRQKNDAAEDVGAAKLWLLNRRPIEWRERKEVEVTGTLEHRLAQMTPEERRARLLELRARAALVIDGEAAEVEE
jgi:transposase